MSLETDMTLLGEVPPFRALRKDHLRLLAFSSVKRELSPGKVLFLKGEKADSGFVVDQGTIVLTLTDGDQVKSVTSCGHGTLIGETALFVETTRRGTARASGDSTVLELTRYSIARMIEEFPELAGIFRDQLARRISGTIAELQEVRGMLHPLDAIAKGRA